MEFPINMLPDNLIDEIVKKLNKLSYFYLGQHAGNTQKKLTALNVLKIESPILSGTTKKTIYIS